LRDTTLIRNHLCRDPFLRPLVDTYFKDLPHARTSPHLQLMQSIAGQQLHVKAAETIWRRFLGLFDNPNPTADEVLALPLSQMRKAGLSESKCNSIHQFCELLTNEKIDDLYWLEAEQNQIIEKLCYVKGIGLWTAEMFLLFACGRPDIFSIGDFALKDAVMKLYDIPYRGKELNREIQSISAMWTPYRSYAALILWAWRDEELRRA